MLHWVHKYLAIPYRPGGRDRTGLDCWGLLKLVYREQFGIELPEMPLLAPYRVRDAAGLLRSEQSTSWTELAAPIDGCGIGLSQRSALHHVGIWAAADGGKIIHCLEPRHGHEEGSAPCVAAVTKRDLWLQGWLVIKFYRHNLWST
jgi:cell wall-associated NlpC family hydrolase